MRELLLVFSFVFFTSAQGVWAQLSVVPNPETAPSATDNQTPHFVKVNGLSLYYEIQGHGAPILLIHGNGGSSSSVRKQLVFFSQNRRVIVADSRSHGRSESAPDPLTYEQIADDLSELLKTLNIPKADVWGHSDGGIVALLLGIRHPEQVHKLISSSANLRPDETALRSNFLRTVQKNAALATEKLQSGDKSQDWARKKQQLELMLKEPHITANDLAKITAPTLIIGSDNDIMPIEHIIEIYNGIKGAQLFIMPGTTHKTPSSSELYNLMLARFLEP